MPVPKWLAIGVYTFALFMILIGTALGGTFVGSQQGVPNDRLSEGTGCGAIDDPTTVSAAGADAYFEKHHAPFSGTGTDLVAAAQEFSVSPALMIGISRAEGTLDGNGLGVPNKNPGNIKTDLSTLEKAGIPSKGKDSQGHVIFPDWQSGWRGHAHLLRTFYLSKERTTVEAIAEIYFTNKTVEQNWINVVKSTMKEVCEKEPTTPGGCIALADASGLTFEHPNDHVGVPKGEIEREEGDPNGGPKDQKRALVTVDPNICDSLIGLVNKDVPVHLTSVVGKHPRWVKRSNPRRESPHWTGRAMDSANNCAVAQFLFENRTKYNVNQIITVACPAYNVDGGEPVPVSRWSPGLQEDHKGHIHIGF